jgi:hypothetical protein
MPTTSILNLTAHARIEDMRAYAERARDARQRHQAPRREHVAMRAVARRLRRRVRPRLA